nr:MAG TPA: hypothetical protein [Caudoviricetes sp.]
MSNRFSSLNVNRVIIFTSVLGGREKFDAL